MFDYLIIGMWFVINLIYMICVCPVITEFCVHGSLCQFQLFGCYLILVLY